MSDPKKYPYTERWTHPDTKQKYEIVHVSALRSVAKPVKESVSTSTKTETPKEPKVTPTKKKVAKKKVAKKKVAKKKS